MKFTTRKNLRTACLLGASLLAACSVALLSGCKGNTTSAASLERAVGKPPAIEAFSAPSDPRVANPLSSALWQQAHWFDFTAPANTPKTTALTRAALFFDSNTLYVAFVSSRQPAPVARDVVTVFLDSTASGDGTEMIEVSLDSAGRATNAWIHTSVPAERREDGSPNLGHPLSLFPDVMIKDLFTRVDAENGTDLWTAVIGIPLKALPMPLQTVAAGGAHWKFNLIRTVTGLGGHERLQSNLSPVYVGAQEFSPYRMADLNLVK